MKTRPRRTFKAVLAVAVAVVLASAAPAVASAVPAAPVAKSMYSFAVSLKTPATTDKVVVASTPFPAALRTAAYRTATPVSKAAAASVGAASASSSSRRTAAVKRTSSSGELAQARAILAGLIAQHPILRGTTVSFGSTPGNAQAVAYYTSGRIVVNPNHTASLSRILNHEIWHIIDWRDNGQIDWYENVPPHS